MYMSKVAERSPQLESFIYSRRAADFGEVFLPQVLGWEAHRLNKQPMHARIDASASDSCTPQNRKAECFF